MKDHLWVNHTQWGQIENQQVPIYITISTFTSVRPYGVGVGVTSRHTFKLPIPAVDSQNVSNKSYLACAQSEKYSFGFTLRPLGS